MEALLLAGGFGTRLRPLTYTRPKPLLPVAGRPMVEWVLDRLPPQVQRVVVAVNWLADELEAYFAASDRDLEFVVVREAEPLGTAGAVKNCEAHLTSERFFVLNADIVSSMDLAAMVKQHEATGAVGTIALTQVPRAEVVNYGVASLAEDDVRRITGFVEKPARPEDAPSHLINAGAYLLERSVLDLIPAGRLVSMEQEIFPKLLAKGFYGWSFDGLWVDVGDPARLRGASHALDAAFVAGPGSRLDGAVVESILGRDCVVEAGGRVEHSVLGHGVRVQAGAVLRDCVVGDGEQVSGQRIGERVWSRPVPEGYPQKQVGNVLG
jgi:mannose-1-phosphate guanylyltransferase